jgi:hypothetical protein
MSKAFFSTVFRPYYGFVYDYVGEVTDNPTHHITEKFIQAIGRHDVSTTVTEVGSYGWVIYVDKEVTVDDSDFVLMCDLTPDVYVEVPFEDPINGDDSTQINPPSQGGQQ